MHFKNQQFATRGNFELFDFLSSDVPNADNESDNLIYIDLLENIKGRASNKV